LTRGTRSVVGFIAHALATVHHRGDTQADTAGGTRAETAAHELARCSGRDRVRAALCDERKQSPGGWVFLAYGKGTIIVSLANV